LHFRKKKEKTRRKKKRKGKNGRVFLPLFPLNLTDAFEIEEERGKKGGKGRKIGPPSTLP